MPAHSHRNGGICIPIVGNKEQCTIPLADVHEAPHQGLLQGLEMTPLDLPSLTAMPSAGRDTPDRPLHEQQALLDRQRAEFEEEQRLLRDYWRRQHQEEWDRLRAEAARQASSLAQQRAALQQKQADLEVARRQQEEQRQAFERERQAWREEQSRRQQEMNEAAQALASREGQLEVAERQFKQARRDGERLRLTRERELEGLEKRISGYRGLLEQLRQEVELHTRPPEPMTPARPPDTSGILELLPRLARVVDELFAEQLRLVDTRSQLLAVQESWGLEWQRVESELARREEELEQEFRSLEMRQQGMRRLAASAQRQLEEIKVKQKLLLGQEAQLLHARSVLDCERGELLAKVKAKALAARNRSRLAARLLQALQREEVTRLARREETEQALAKSHRALLDRHEALDQREHWLDEREKHLLGREWVVRTAEEQLIHHDPNPAGARDELNRRLEIVQKMSVSAQGRAEIRAADLAEAMRGLEEFRQRLLSARTELDAEQTQLRLLRLDLAAQQTRLAAEREGWQARLAQWMAERRRLRNSVRDLQDQVERLTLLVMDTRPPEPLAIAA